MDQNKFSKLVRRNPFVVILFLLILPSWHTVPHVLLTPENPKGEISFPENITVDSEGFVLIVLDGIGEDYFLDEKLMPEINEYRKNAATVKIRTGPLTLSATCISEMMTGVPNAPINGLRNFNLGHPGNSDPWLLAANDPRYSVAMVGSYVMGNLYQDFSNVNFVNTFKGHSDYYKGDYETLIVASEWLNDSKHNVLAIHFSGPDKVGHTWGADSPEYDEKLTHVDQQVSQLLNLIPDEWSVVITADHGMTEMGTHGSSEDITRDVAAIISGPQIIPKSESIGHQRDLSAIMPLILELPFPVQLHGRIPLEIFDYSIQEKSVIEQWNWNAAYQRQTFFDEKENRNNIELSSQNIDWDLLSSDGEFTRDSDIYVSVFTWILIAILSIMALGLNKNQIIENKMFFAIFAAIITLFLLSHALLNYSAMLPRAIGGLCAVWLVGWSLGGIGKNVSQSDQILSSKLEKLLHNPQIWFFTCCLIGLIFWSVLKAMVIVLFVYSVLFSMRCGFVNKASDDSKLPPFWAWIIALLCMTFGSIRLWYALLPFMFILVGNLLRSNGKPTIEKVPIYSILMLTFFAVFFIHRRIYGDNYILEAVESGWPSNLQNILISSSLLILTSIVSVAAHYNGLKPKKSAIFSIWLIFGLFVSAVESSYLDMFALLLTACACVGAIYIRKNEPKSDLATELPIFAIAMLLLLTWGAWSVFSTLLILTSCGSLWRILSKDLAGNLQVNDSKTIVAMAVYPWVIWVLWWTLLGQVNGLQTCFEGICPHPRELDPGTVLVRGGYVGFREDPNLFWMVFMIASPIIITSFMILDNLQKTGLSLYPYIVFQSLIILGCISVIGFSPKYPRLVFSLTWNVFFAAFQLILAVSILFLRNLRLSPVESTVHV